LIAGAVIEDWPKLKQIGFLTAKWVLFRCNSFERCILKKLILHSVGALLVVFGIAGELVFETRTFIVEDAESTAANIEIGQLKVRARELEQQNLILQEQAGANEKEAEDERLASIKIEESLMWRRLDKKIIESVASKLERFRDSSASVWYDAGDTESHGFAWDIAEALNSAKWNVLAPAGRLAVAQMGIPFGSASVAAETGVDIRSTNGNASKEAAQALVRELNALGFDATLGTTTEPGVLNIVWVNVKTKPRGPQGVPSKANR
jgi:hypothetical protein